MKKQKNKEYLRLMATIEAAPSAVADLLETIADKLEELASEKKAKELHLELYIVDINAKKRVKADEK